VRRWISRCSALIWTRRLLIPMVRKAGVPFDPVMMFKVLVIQTTNTLSDERTQFLINDRLPFVRSLGLRLPDFVSGSCTIWLFAERLIKAGAIGPLFERFDAKLRRPVTSPC
jgi:transposase, IS5 family